MKLIDLFPTAEALFKATHEPLTQDPAENKRRDELRTRIYQENKAVVKGLQCCEEHAWDNALFAAFFCTLDEAIREVTKDESLGASVGRPLC